MEHVQTQFLICRKSGCSLAPLASFFHMLRASGMLGQHPHHIGLMLSHLSGILWFVLAFVEQALGSYWAYLGPFWVMWGHLGLCRHHIGLMLSHLGLFWGLCWGSYCAILGYFGVCVGFCLEFSSMQGVCKKKRKYHEKRQFLGCHADGFCCYFFGCFCFFSFGACCT